MNTIELLRPVTDARGGIILDSPDGELLLLDRFVRGVLPLPRALEPPLQTASFLSLVDQFYSRLGNCPEITGGKFVLYVDLEDILEDLEFCAKLAQILKSLAKDSSIDLMIHFSHPPDDWAEWSSPRKVDTELRCS